VGSGSIYAPQNSPGAHQTMKPIVERRAVAVGYLVRVLTNESESRVFGNLGKNTLATVTSVFGHIVAFG